MNRDIEWLFSNEPVDEQRIVSIESQLNIVFPEDYIECAKNNHGGHPSLQIYDFGGHQEAVFNGLLSLASNDKNSVLSVYNNVKDRFVSGIYPFADDPFGNLICFDYRNSDSIPSVVFWDHDLCYENPEKAILPICRTFTELMLSLRAE